MGAARFGVKFTVGFRVRVGLGAKLCALRGLRSEVQGSLSLIDSKGMGIVFLKDVLGYLTKTPPQTQKSRAARLCVSVSPCLCVSVCLCVCVSVSLCVCVSVCLPCRA